MTPTISDTDPLVASRTDVRSARVLPSGEAAHGSAVAWPAIFAGAAGAAALSLILLVLGMGLGLSSVSPWAARGVSATTFGVGTIAWILLVALVASGTGGFLAGRLRTKWVEAHSDEVYFRDTAHGFLAWAVATLVTAATLSSAVGTIVGAGANAGTSAVGAAGSAAVMAAGAAMSEKDKPATVASSLDYFTDSLFRPMPAASAASGTGATPADQGNASGTSIEVGRIFARGLAGNALSADDSRYVGQLVAQRTGMTQQDAEKRATDTFAKAQQSIQDAEAKAKEAADKARKAAAYISLWIFVSLLLGAFVSSLMATFGGRQRDL